MFQNADQCNEFEKSLFLEFRFQIGYSPMSKTSQKKEALDI